MSKNTPFFSICIPLYNHEKYVGLTIQSVLDQDFDDFEIIIADNASTDKSREVVKSFSDPRIQLIENRYNIGFAPNLQHVTRFAGGRFLNLLSSDDLMEQGTLRTLVNIINSTPASDQSKLLIFSQSWEVDGNGKIFRYITRTLDNFAPKRVSTPTQLEIECQPLQEIFRGSEIFVKCMKNLNTAGVFCATIYAHELWQEVEGYNSTQLISPDMDFIIKVLRQDPMVIYVNRPLYSYRKHSVGQGGQQEQAKVLKRPVDYYNYLMRFDENWLEGTGVTPDDQRKLFIKRDCINVALVSLANYQWVYSIRLAAFAFATYPREVLKINRFWIMVLLLVSGPFGMWVMRWKYNNIDKTLPTLVEMSK